MRFITLRLVVPAVLVLSLGDVSPAAATDNNNPVVYGQHAAGCRGKTVADQNILGFHKYFGLYNVSDSANAVVVCPMGGVDHSGSIIARVSGWRDNLKPFKCTYTATDAWGTKFHTETLAESVSPGVDLTFVYSATAAAYGYAECTLTPKAPPLPGSTKERFAYLSSVTLQVGL